LGYKQRTLGIQITNALSFWQRTSSTFWTQVEGGIEGLKILNIRLEVKMGFSFLMIARSKLEPKVS
jgi:hypothetical protein